MIPTTSSMPIRSPATRAVSSDRMMMNMYRPSAASTPRKPCSSANTEKMKSLCAAGRKLYWLCVPCRNPLPVTPPDPTVMRAWICW